MKRIAVSLALTAVVAAAAVAATEAVFADAARPNGRRTRDHVRSAQAAVASETALPSAIAAQLTQSGTASAELGAEPSQGSYHAINATTHVWVVPGRAGTCLVIPSAGGWIAIACGLTATIDAHGLIETRSTSSGPVLTGYVPAGASVTVASSNGSTAAVAVQGGVFMYEAGPTAQTTVTVHLANGQSSSQPVKYSPAP